MTMHSIAVACLLAIAPPASQPATTTDSRVAAAEQRLEKARQAATGDLPEDARVVDRLYPPRFREPICVLADGTWHIRLPYWKTKAIAHYQQELHAARNPPAPPPPQPLQLDALAGKPVAVLQPDRDHVRAGHVIVATPPASVDGVWVRQSFGEFKLHPGPYVAIPVLLRNTSPTLKVEYKSFVRDKFDMGPFATLTDDLGNTYQRIGLDYDLPIGAVEDAAIYPGKAQLDILVFQPPVAGASTLTLTLPAERVGQTGDLVIRYQIR